MEKYNHLDEVPIASLTHEQLQILQNAENHLNEQDQDVYLIAFKKKQ
ncbi:hypothetical protein [Ammoniphilus sp. CFH 90114]|nr:hypothetical protein [Ammoniphilus sp. CFH 90114]